MSEVLESVQINVWIALIKIELSEVLLYFYSITYNLYHEAEIK